LLSLVFIFKDFLSNIGERSQISRPDVPEGSAVTAVVRVTSGTLGLPDIVFVRISDCCTYCVS
jgi:hypothetical protein